MEMSTIINVLLGIGISAVGWYANRLQKQVDDVAQAQTALELKVAEKSVSKEDFIRFEDKLFKRLDALEYGARRKQDLE